MRLADKLMAGLVFCILITVAFWSLATGDTSPLAETIKVCNSDVRLVKSFGSYRLVGYDYEGGSRQLQSFDDEAKAFNACDALGGS